MEILSEGTFTVQSGAAAPGGIQQLGPPVPLDLQDVPHGHYDLSVVVASVEVIQGGFFFPYPDGQPNADRMLSWINKMYSGYTIQQVNGPQAALRCYLFNPTSSTGYQGSWELARWTP